MSTPAIASASDEPPMSRAQRLGLSGSRSTRAATCTAVQSSAEQEQPRRAGLQEALERFFELGERAVDPDTLSIEWRPVKVRRTVGDHPQLHAGRGFDSAAFDPLALTLTLRQRVTWGLLRDQTHESELVVDLRLALGAVAWRSML